MGAILSTLGLGLTFVAVVTTLFVMAEIWFGVVASYLLMHLVGFAFGAILRDVLVDQ